MIVCLGDLQLGERAKILGFNPGNFAYRQKLLALGLVPNAEVTLVRIAPMGDPIEIRIHNSSICLRKKESAVLQLVRVKSK